MLNFQIKKKTKLCNNLSQRKLQNIEITLFSLTLYDFPAPLGILNGTKTQHRRGTAGSKAQYNSEVALFPVYF